MDYEKKYKEALELMKDCIPDKDGLVHIRPCEIFTELADSEDEKIRKALVDYFTAYKEQKECGIKTFYGIPTDNIIAWLEKQGEQKPACEADCTTTNEWSKEDEICINSIINSLGVFGFSKPEYKVMNQRNIEWLKALKAQRTWKPSKGQIKALEEASNEHWEPDGLDPLYTLLQDLKTLDGD